MRSPTCVECIARRNDVFYKVLVLLRDCLCLPKSAVQAVLYFRFAPNWVDQAMPLLRCGRRAPAPSLPAPARMRVVAPVAPVDSAAAVDAEAPADSAVSGRPLR